MSKHEYKTVYHRAITEFLECDEELAEILERDEEVVDKIYDTMHYEIFHSAMDWVTKEDFESAIVKAFWMLYMIEEEIDEK